MKKKNGKNIYKSNNLAIALENARNSFYKGKIYQWSKHLLYAYNILKYAIDIKEILQYEAICLDIFDVNFAENNIDKISNKLVACHVALNENKLFENNKSKYLNNFISSRVTDIKQDSAFEKSCKEIIRYLGAEKKGILINKELEYFFEIRQNNIKNILKEFSSKRKAFLSKSIQ